MWRARQWSLASRQLVLLVSVLSIAALLLGVGGAWYINGFAERTSDRVLGASVNAIAETVSVQNGEIDVEVLPAAFGMLEDRARDNIYYAIRYRGRTISGYDDFPRPAAAQPRPEAILFRYDNYLGQRVRVATQAHYTPRFAEPVIIEVAETLAERRALTNEMLLRLGLLEALLVIIVALLIPPAIRWGLLPVTKLERQIAERGAGAAATRPIDPAAVPQELHGLVDTFNLLLSRLDDAVRRVRDFTGDASHQMRTPLAALRTHLLLVKRHGSASPEGRAALEEVDGAARRLQRLLTQLLALARSDEAAAGPDRVNKRFDLARQVRDVAGELAPNAIAAGLDLHVEADTPLRLGGNPTIVSEMLANLIDNAIRYSDPGGTVRIRCLADAGSAVVEIEDEGPGIPEAQREAVFQRFTRLPRDRHTDGSGLGLAIVRSLAQASGTSLELASGTGGRGLLVRLRFAVRAEA